VPLYKLVFTQNS